MEKDLFKEGLTEENYNASQFLINKIGNLETVTNFIKALKQIKFDINRFRKDYPNQKEIAEKLIGVVDSYEKILENIEN